MIWKKKISKNLQSNRPSLFKHAWRYQPHPYFDMDKSNRISPTRIADGKYKVRN